MDRASHLNVGEPLHSLFCEASAALSVDRTSQLNVGEPLQHLFCETNAGPSVDRHDSFGDLAVWAESLFSFDLGSLYFSSPWVMFGKFRISHNL